MSETYEQAVKRLRPSLIARLRSAWREIWSPAEDFDATVADIMAGRMHYRIRRAPGGYEPQMLYTAGMIRKAIWFPLTIDGMWLEGDAFSFGNLTRRSIMTHEDAQRAVTCARRINGEQLVAGCNTGREDWWG